MALVAAQAVGAFGGGSPTITAPAPLLLVVPALLGLPAPVVILLFTACFLLWLPSLYAGRPAVPTRSVALGVTVAVVSTAVYAISWSYGLRYQGLAHTTACFALNLLFAMCSLVAVRRARKYPSFNAALAAHTITFVWLASYAFPYLGETP